MNFELDAEQLASNMNMYAQVLRYNGKNQEEVEDFVHKVLSSVCSSKVTQEQRREIEAQVLKQVAEDYSQQEEN